MREKFPKTFGKRKELYGLNDNLVIIGSSRYLLCILAVVNGRKTVEEIGQYIQIRTGDSLEPPQYNIHLKTLVNVGVLEEIDYKPITRGRKKIKYAVNYQTFLDYILENMLFKELQDLGFQVTWEYIQSQEIKMCISSLFERYIINFDKYLNKENPKYIDNKTKEYLDYIDNLKIKIENQTFNLIDFRLKDLKVIDFMEGFFKYLKSNPNLLHETIRYYFKQTKKPFNYVLAGKIDTFLLFLELYFSRDRSEVLLKINQYYEIDYEEKLKRGKIKFDFP